jgi:cysteine desulfurase/selenocysteine lyase
MGYLTPIAEIIGLARQVNAISVIDCAQSVYSEKIDVRKLGADFVAFSGHKMLAPTGIGVLYGKKELLKELDPIEFGGDMNDFVTIDDAAWKDAPYRFEAGTMPIAGAIGLKAALDYLNGIGLELIDRHLKDLYRYAWEKLQSIKGVKLYNPGADKGIITFNLEGVPSHDAVSYYAEAGVLIRSGHHCAQLVNAFLGVDSSLRASFHIYTDYEDIDRFVEVTKSAVNFFHNLGF